MHGLCPTDFTVNTREDIATDVTVSRDLSRCDSFFARRQHVSPLALITGMVRNQAVASSLHLFKPKPKFAGKFKHIAFPSVKQRIMKVKHYPGII